MKWYYSQLNIVASKLVSYIPLEKAKYCCQFTNSMRRRILFDDSHPTLSH